MIIIEGLLGCSMGRCVSWIWECPLIEWTEDVAWFSSRFINWVKCSVSLLIINMPVIMLTMGPAFCLSTRMTSGLLYVVFVCMGFLHQCASPAVMKSNPGSQREQDSKGLSWNETLHWGLFILIGKVLHIWRVILEGCVSSRSCVTDTRHRHASVQLSHLSIKPWCDAILYCLHLIADLHWLRLVISLQGFIYFLLILDKCLLLFAHNVPVSHF